VAAPEPTPSEQLLEATRALAAEGLSPGSSGNLSFRRGSGFVITPSGVAPGALEAASLVRLDLAGRVLHGALAPSSEWPMHAALYRTRSDVGAVVHCHSPYATTLACARRAIPPLHYMIAVAARDEVPCAEYAAFGSDALAASAVDALGERWATLLANHGQIAVGRDLEHALWVAREVETLARTYWGTLAIGGPVPLSPAEIDAVNQRIGNYGPAAR
jgi:L-fuculose-phosphate aldolase